MTAQTEALRKLADFIDEHPELDFGAGWDHNSVHADNDALGIHIKSHTTDGEKKSFTRAIIKALGGAWDKSPLGDGTMTFDRSGVFGYFEATIFVDRDAVCERRLVGTKDVKVPAQEAVEAHVETVPVYEWECGSLLAPSERELEAVTA